MIDWSKFVLPVLLGVVGSPIGSVLGFYLAQAGLFHLSPIVILVFFWAGALTGFGIGLWIWRGRPLSPRTKQSIRLLIGAMFFVSGIVEALLDLSHGVISWGLLEPTASIAVGLYLLIPSSRLTSTKSARFLVIAIAGIMSILLFASAYVTKQYSDLAMWTAGGISAALGVLFLQRRKKRNLAD